MIVVDTNVIAYLLIPGEHSQDARQLLKKDPEWISPYLWRSEFRSVLSLYIRKGFLSYPDSVLLMKEAENLLLGMEYEVRSELVLEIIKQSNISAYDAEFVALAKDLKLKLYTSDKSILKEFPVICRPLSKV